MKHFFISIYLVMIFGFLFLTFSIFPITHGILESKPDFFIEEIARGTFSLVQERLAGLDEKERKRWRKNNLQVKFVITLPKKFNLELKTSGGSISVTDLEGQVQANPQ